MIDTSTLPACPNCDRILVLDGTMHQAPVGPQHVATCPCGARAGLMQRKAGAWEIVWIRFPEPQFVRVIDPEAP